MGGAYEQTNERILELKKDTENLVDNSAQLENAVVIPPCYIGKNTVVKNSIIGPYVSIGDNSTIGKTARSAEPFICQVFIGLSDGDSAGLNFERKLYCVRKRVARDVRSAGLVAPTTLASRTPAAADVGHLSLWRRGIQCDRLVEHADRLLRLDRPKHDRAQQ